MIDRRFRGRSAEFRSRSARIAEVEVGERRTAAVLYKCIDIGAEAPVGAMFVNHHQQSY